MRLEQNNTLLTRDFLTVTLIGFIFFFNFHSLLLLPLHIKSLGGSEAVIGFLMGTAGLSTLLSTPVAGYLGDRAGKKLFMTAGLLLLSASTVSLVFINNTGYLYYILRAVHGFAFSLFFISAGAIITDIAPESRRTQAVGLYGVFTIINYAIAPYVGKVIISDYGFPLMFFLTGGLTFLSIPLGLTIKAGNKIRVTGDDPEQSYREILSVRETFIPSLTLLTTGAAFIPVLTFIPVFSETRGISSFDIYFITYTAAVLFIRIFCGWIPDKFGKGRIVKPSLFLFGISVLILAFTQDLITFILSALLFGISHGFVYPSLYSIVIDNTRSVSRTRAFAICSLAFTGGGMTGTFISGLLAHYYGYTVMYLFLTGVLFVSFWIFAFYYRKGKFK